jgi:hypothetical protein
VYCKTKDSFSFALPAACHAPLGRNALENKRESENKMISLSLFFSIPLAVRSLCAALPSGGSGAKKRDWLRAKLFPLWRVVRALNGATIGAINYAGMCAAQFSETGPLKGEPL